MGQGNRPIAFASQKLTATQKAWSTIEKEAYAAIWALQKFRNWIFGQPTTVIYSDHNPLTYITESSTKSAKLMRWLLSLQSYNVTFKYKEGRKMWWQIAYQGWILPQNEGVLSGESFSSYLVCI